MSIFNPVDLSKYCGGEWTTLPKVNIEGFCFDSRNAKQGDLFIALRAERDGHNFIKQAISSGAVAALVDHKVVSEDCPQLIVEETLAAFQQIAKSHRKKFTNPVVGVTGSCGKTSTKEMLKVLLSGSHCTEGNFNNHIGVPITLTNFSISGHPFAVVEAGINMPGEMDVLADMICPDIAVITSIDHSHLAGLGTIEMVANEKIKLWLYSQDSCLAIFPEELEKFKPFSDAMEQCKGEFIKIKKAKIGSVELQDNLALYEVSTETNERGHSQNLSIERCGCPPLVVRIPEASDGTIRNMVLACVTAWKLGVSDKEICERLPQYRPSGLRGSCLVGRGSSYVLDCYNANPASMIDSVNFFFERYQDEPKLLVLGSMNELGDASDQLHFKTGKSIHLNHCDQAVLIGDYSINLANGMMESGAREEQISILPNPENARPLIEEFKGAVLIKGSRAYKLERLIPQWAVEEYEPMKIAC